MSGTNLAAGELAAYRKAGRIASLVRERVVRLVKPGEKILRICEEAENFIRRNGGTPAFPLNVSINHIAAHYTSPPGDKSTIPEDGLVKVDLGVSVGGYLSDTATTVDLSRRENALVETADKALKAAIAIMKAGTSVGKVGETISNVISGAGLKPIANLTGHSLARNVLHSGTSVPNVPAQLGHMMKEGEVYAIEPFVTKKDGKGFVSETRNTYIFSCRGDASTLGNRDESSTALFNEFIRNFGRLPFTARWLNRGVDQKEFRKLLKGGQVLGYPVLAEAGKKMVAQAEHTVLVKKYSCEVLTGLG